MEKTASEAAKRKFAPEFMNRIDKMIVFHPLRSEQLEQILEIELGMVISACLKPQAGDSSSASLSRLGIPSKKKERT